MRISNNNAFFFGWAILIFLGSTLRARQIEDWPYDKLFKHADLVIIAKPLAVREAGKDDHAIPPKGHDEILTGVVTTFEVLHVIKGEYKANKMDLVHFRLKKGVQIGNGPCLVNFPTKAIELRGDGWAAGVTSDYMLFLKKSADGRFEPVSGQFDPSLSVKQMMGPLP